MHDDISPPGMSSGIPGERSARVVSVREKRDYCAVVVVAD
jgi:hypothetical protein